MTRDRRKEDYVFALEGLFKKARLSYYHGMFFCTIVLVVLSAVFLLYASPPQYQLPSFWILAAYLLSLLIFWSGLTLIRNRAISTINAIEDVISPAVMKRIENHLRKTFISRRQLIIPTVFAVGSIVWNIYYTFIKPEAQWVAAFAYNPSLGGIYGWYGIITTGIVYFSVGLVLYFAIMNAALLYAAGEGIIPEKMNVWHPDGRFGLSSVGKNAFAVSAIWLLGGMTAFIFSLLGYPLNYWTLAALSGFIVCAIGLFLLPLFAYRKIISRIREKAMDELSESYRRSSDIFRALLSTVNVNADDSTMNRVGRVNDAILSLDKQIDKLRRVSLWPIDAKTWRRFTVSIALSLMPALLSRLLPLLGLI